MKITGSLLFSVLLSCFFGHSVAQPGFLDGAFSQNGLQTIGTSSNAEHGRVVLIQSDGKVVVAGYSYNGSDNQMFVYRCFPNGDPDTDFGTNGWKDLDLGPSNDRLFGGVLQPDGKMVFVGPTDVNGTDGFGVYRLNPDGSWDDTFDNDGIAIYNPSGISDIPVAVDIQQDGRIVIFGTTVTTNDYVAAVMRLNSNGSIDQSFSGDGLAITPFSNIVDLVGSGLIQSDGKIIVAGNTAGSIGWEFAMARINPNGSLDNSFGTNGTIHYQLGISGSFCRHVALQPDGKIIAVGESGQTSGSVYTIARFNQDGTYDTSFGVGGVVYHSITAGNDIGQRVLIQPDGKLIVIGNSAMSSQDISLSRFLADGTVDTDFGSAGSVITPIGTSDDFAYAATFDANGDIWVVGEVAIMASFDVFIAKYKNDLNLGITSESTEPPISVYPNPVRDQLFVEFDVERKSMVGISLFDGCGRMVKTASSGSTAVGSQRFTLDVSDLKSGTYLLSVNGSRWQANKLVVIQ